MDSTIANVAITAIILGVPAVVWIVYAGLRHEERKAQIEKGADGGEVARLNAVIDQLSADMVKVKDRVQVLERLATDDDRRIADEISQLRETRS